MKTKKEEIKKAILNKIANRIYSEGQLIDSETNLCSQHGASRMTVRKALDELVMEGVIYKEKGRGSFVAKKPKYSEFRCGVGFSDEVLKRGMIPSTKDATLELVEADKVVANDLGIKVKEKVWKVTRVRCADNTPIIYVEEYYLYSLCPDLTLEITKNSVYNHLKKKGIINAFTDQKLEAGLASDLVAKKIGVKKGHPIIIMTLIVYMKNGVAYNCGTEYYRTDKFKLVQSIYNN